MSTITKEQAQKIIEAADEVITALAGTNEDVHPESNSMLRLWDDLNDRYAPPEVVRELARIALASLEAEPVCVIDQSNLDYLKSGSDADVWPASRTEMGDVILYRSAPPAPVLPRDLEEIIFSIVNAMADEKLRNDESELFSLAKKYIEHAKSKLGAAMLQGADGNSPLIPDSSEDTKRLNWLDVQNKRLNEYYGTSYGWKFDANFQRNAMMLNDSNYPVMTVRQAIDEAIAAAPQQEVK